MRKTLFATSLLAFVLVVVLAGNVYTNRAGAPAGHSGGAGELTCATTSCHQGTLNSGPGILTITSDAPGNVYSPNTTYNITVKLVQPSIARFGFEVLWGYKSVGNKSVGTVVHSAPTHTQNRALSQKKYVTHTTLSTSAQDSQVWSFQWTAPDSSEGDLTFFVAGNAANNNNSRFGDLIYTSSMTLTAPPVGIDFGSKAFMTVYPTLTHGQLNMELEGLGVAPVLVRVMDATGRVVHEASLQPAGTSLVRTMDFAHLGAGLYYLEARVEGQSLIRKFVKN